MSSCECCWSEASQRTFWTGESVSDVYHVVMKDHEAKNCICTKKTDEGNQARAGQFWKEGKDSRDEPRT